jgi:hypothetical protein
MKYLKYLILTMVFVGKPALAAGGWTSYAAPAEVEVVREQGFIIFGAFGQPGATGCTVPDAIFVPIDHAQYNALLSTALTAVSGGLSLRVYVRSCTAVGWHGGTFNTLSGSDALYIKK